MTPYARGTKVRYTGPAKRAIEINATYGVQTGQALYVVERLLPISEHGIGIDAGGYVVYTSYDGIQFEGDRLRVPTDQVERW